jgi:hypothetical protein
VNKASQCYNSVILPVYEMRFDDWYQYVSFPNINGVFGMAYFADYLDMNSFWFNMISQGYNTTMAISLLPSSTDQSWIPQAPDCSNTSNTLMIGDYNRTDYILAGTNTSLTLTSAYPNVWIFNSNVSFGLVNTTNTSAITEYYTMLTNDDYYQVLL